MYTQHTQLTDNNEHHVGQLTFASPMLFPELSLAQLEHWTIQLPQAHSYNVPLFSHFGHILAKQHYLYYVKPGQSL